MSSDMDENLAKIEDLELISHVDMKGFSGGKQFCIAKTGLNTCVCCLSKNVPLVSLANCKHVEFFDCSLKFKLEYSDTLVCHVCHGVLKDIYLFKRQVETSLLKFNQQIENYQTKNIKLSKLETSDIEIFHTFNSEPIAKDVVKAKAIFEIKTEVKIEIDDAHSDPENDVTVSEIKESKEKKDKDPNTPFFQHKYQGKIKIVMLSEQEMWEERRREAAEEKYLKLLYRCENCIVGYDHEMTLKEHMEKRHSEVNGGSTCEICKSVLISTASFKEHMRRHYRRIECSSCGVRYTTVRTALTHYSKAHGDLPTKYDCVKCDFTTWDYRRLRYHRDSHKEKVRCEECGKTFVNNSGLKVHIYTVHETSDRVYSCAECSKSYRQRSGLLSHMNSAHGSHGGAYCAPCRTHFRTEQSLKYHLSTHRKHISDEDKKFVCGSCDARFLTKAQLKQHEDWEHLKKTNYRCDECNKAFKTRSCLRRHNSYVHKKKRPPRNKMCDHCGRGFTTMSILRSHIRTHTGERPYSCEHCQATFAHSAALYTHKKLLHSQKKSMNAG